MITLLGPAGNLEALRAAIDAGADAIFVGAEGYSRRSRDLEMSDREIEQALSICRKAGRSLRVAMNCIPSIYEQEKFLDKIDSLVARGIDGIILSDPGLIAETRKRYKDLTIQASVCLAIMNVQDAKFYKQIGASMVVLPYQVYHDLRAIHEEAKIGIELFPHGYRNYTFRGKCLISCYIRHSWPEGPLNMESAFGSFNREGLCYRGCKLPYEMYRENKPVLKEVTMNSYPFYALDELPRYFEFVDCLKVQGRENSPALVREMVSFYRRLIDEYYSNPAEFTIKHRDYEEWDKLEKARNNEMRGRTHVLQNNLEKDIKGNLSA